MGQCNCRKKRKVHERRRGTGRAGTPPQRGRRAQGAPRAVPPLGAEPRARGDSEQHGRASPILEPGSSRGAGGIFQGLAQTWSHLKARGTRRLSPAPLDSPLGAALAPRNLSKDAQRQKVSCFPRLSNRGCPPCVPLHPWRIWPQLAEPGRGAEAPKMAGFFLMGIACCGFTVFRGETADAE